MYSLCTPRFLPCSWKGRLVLCPWIAVACPPDGQARRPMDGPSLSTKNGISLALSLLPRPTASLFSFCLHRLTCLPVFRFVLRHPSFSLKVLVNLGHSFHVDQHIRSFYPPSSTSSESLHLPFPSVDRTFVSLSNGKNLCDSDDPNIQSRKRQTLCSKDSLSLSLSPATNNRVVQAQTHLLSLGIRHMRTRVSCCTSARKEHLTAFVYTDSRGKVQDTRRVKAVCVVDSFS